MSKIINLLNQNDSRSVYSSYARLRDQIQKTLLAGRERAEELVETEKARTYWEVGRQIDSYLLKHSIRAEYGGRLITQLSKDLGTSETTLYDSLKFARTYPILGARPKLGWRHYRALISVDDSAQRSKLEKSVEKLNWSSRQLESEINKLSSDKAAQSKEKSGKSKMPNRLIPKKGLPGTYLVKEPANKAAGAVLRLDLGFYVFFDLPVQVSKKLKAEDIVFSSLAEKSGVDPIEFKKSSKENLFTYRAVINKIVDGDTFWVTLFLGFGITLDQKLRLRGIDAPEMDTAEGREAKKFVESELRDIASVLIVTTKPDKYDRYLSDVFYTRADGTECFLNQMLLDRGLARLAGAVIRFE